MHDNATSEAANAKRVSLDRTVILSQLIQTLDALADYCETFGDEPAEMVRKFNVRRVLELARGTAPARPITERIVCVRCGTAVAIGEQSVRTLCPTCETEVRP